MFKGNTDKGIRRGFGVQLFLTGELIIGNWKKNQLYGLAHVIMSPDYWIIGEFKNSLLDLGVIHFD